jgi:4-aminobutyrate aminotransferase
MGRWAPGSEGGTYGGNVVACAAAVATICVLRDEGLLRNAQLRGEQLVAGLRQIQSRQPSIGDIRGLGLMVGVEFTDAGGGPDKGRAKAVQAACLEENLLMLSCGTWDNVTRFVPPLVVSAEQIEDGLRRFERALAQALPRATGARSTRQSAL